MDSILFWAGALIVFTVLSPLIKLLIASFAGRQIGAKVLAEQPDRITLHRGGASSWKNAGPPRKAVAALASRGFDDAGVYTIAEMPGLVVQLLAHSGDGLYAAMYEHPQAGHWLDLVSRFQDGTSLTCSTSRPTALKPRPGHLSKNMPGTDPLTVLDRTLAMRPRRTLEEVSASKAVEVFESSYAESVAYRKQVGISTGEVVGTAVRKVA